MMKQREILLVGKNSLTILFIISIVFSTITNAYESKKGKIDMHGGKEDALTSKSAFGMAVGIGAVLNKKSSDEKKKKDNKNFIALDKKESIDKIDSIKE